VAEVVYAAIRASYLDSVRQGGMRPSVSCHHADFRFFSIRQAKAICFYAPKSVFCATKNNFLFDSYLCVSS
jgi:hypothetical protein